MIQKTLEQHHVKKQKKPPLIRYVTGKRKSSRKLDLLDHSGTYYVLKDWDIRKRLFVPNLNVKNKKVFFFDQQQSEQNNTAEQSDELLQLYIDKNHSYKANSLIRDNIQS